MVTPPPSLEITWMCACQKDFPSHNAIYGDVMFTTIALIQVVSTGQHVRYTKGTHYIRYTTRAQAGFARLLHFMTQWKVYGRHIFQTE